MKVLIVTRHKALVEYIRQVAGPEAETWEVRSHVTREEISDPFRWHIVIGVLPISLAVYADMVVEIPLNLKPEDRGKELSLPEMRERIAGKARAYSVRYAGEWDEDWQEDAKEREAWCRRHASWVMSMRDLIEEEAKADRERAAKRGSDDSQYG